ncbi:MAG: hypothetical protein LBI05_03595 [Planctomycetaceae bacterium]|nr:hypothetical protein [Planctomycetaceae bacterium]
MPFGFIELFPIVGTLILLLPLYFTGLQAIHSTEAVESSESIQVNRQFSRYSVIEP